MPEGNDTPDSNEQWIDLVPVKAVAKINLVQRLHEAEHAAKHPAKASPSGTPPQPTKIPWLMIAAVTSLAVLGLAAGWALTWVDTKPSDSLKPTATPSLEPSPSATPRFTPQPTPTPAPPANTYTVQPGDTLITIGEKLGKDWRAIAAANGNITDPNFITPGQVLRIP